MLKLLSQLSIIFLLSAGCLKTENVKLEVWQDTKLIHISVRNISSETICFRSLNFYTVELEGKNNEYVGYSGGTLTNEVISLHPQSKFDGLRIRYSDSNVEYVTMSLYLLHCDILKAPVYEQGALALDRNYIISRKFLKEKLR